MTKEAKAFNRFGPTELPRIYGKGLLDSVLATLNEGAAQVLMEVHLHPSRYLGDAETIDILRRPKILQAAKESYIARMRFLANGWINSGKKGTPDPNGRLEDYPSKRTVEYPVESEGGSAPLYKHLLHGLDHVHVTLGDVLLENGRAPDGLSFQPFTINFRERPYLDAEEIAASFGWAAATYWFRVLLNSPDASHFSRCDHCQRYFQYLQTRLRPTMHGVYCKECTKMGAAARNINSRTIKKDNLIKLAAVASVELKSNDTVANNSIIAALVSKRGGSTVRKNWVTLHRVEIQTQIETMSDATT